MTLLPYCSGSLSLTKILYGRAVYLEPLGDLVVFHFRQIGQQDDTPPLQGQSSQCPNKAGVLDLKVHVQDGEHPAIRGVAVRSTETLQLPLGQFGKDHFPFPLAGVLQMNIDRLIFHQPLAVGVKSVLLVLLQAYAVPPLPGGS